MTVPRGPSAAVILLLTACCLATVGCGALSTQSEYDRTLDVLSAVMRQDRYWKHVFDQNVYHVFDKRFKYSRFYDGELIPGAVPAGDGGGSGDGGAREPGAELVSPQAFLRNVFAKRYRLGSVLKTALDVVHKAFTCLAYKHFSHTILLVRYEIARNLSQDKATSWSNKAKLSVTDVLRRMAALRHTDELLLRCAKFLSVYGRDNTFVLNNKYKYTPALDAMIGAMKEYMGQNCTGSVDDKDIAAELALPVTKSLYDTAGSKAIGKPMFKTMVKGSLDRIKEHFGGLPYALGAMNAQRWNEILRFELIPEEKTDPDVFKLIDR